jgi:predicted small secreted protein
MYQKCSSLILVFLLLSPLLAGCYTYRAVEDARPGADVRARLGTEAAVRRSAGRDEAVMIYAGRLVASTPEALTLDVLLYRDPSQFSRAELRETVTLQRGEIQSLMVRELSPTRSVLLAAGIGAAALAIVSGINAITGGNDGGPADETPRAYVMPARSDVTPRRPAFLLVQLRLP